MNWPNELISNCGIKFKFIRIKNIISAYYKKNGNGYIIFERDIGNIYHVHHPGPTQSPCGNCGKTNWKWSSPMTNECDLCKSNFSLTTNGAAGSGGNGAAEKPAGELLLPSGRAFTMDEYEEKRKLNRISSKISKKCTCGGDSIGGHYHYDWCDKNESA